MGLYFQGESGSDYSPNKLPHGVLMKSISPPPVRYQRVPQSVTRKRETTTAGSSTGTTGMMVSSKYQMPRYPEEQALHQVRPTPLLSGGSGTIGATTQLTAGSTLMGIKRYEMTVMNSNHDSSLGELRKFYLEISNG